MTSSNFPRTMVATPAHPEPDVTVAVYDTPHFRFVATGTSRDAALAALKAAWLRHCQDTGADEEYLLLEDVNTVTGPVGSVWRDWSRV